MHVCTCDYEYIYEYRHARARTHARTHTHTHTQVLRDGDYVIVEDTNLDGHDKAVAPGCYIPK